jgi:hypothetical protein
LALISSIARVIALTLSNPSRNPRDVGTPMTIGSAAFARGPGFTRKTIEIAITNDAKDKNDFSLIALLLY